MTGPAHPHQGAGEGAGWSPRKPKYDWRAFLTIEERDKLSEAWDAKQHWLALNKESAAITNRAIQRAKYAARPPLPPDARTRGALTKPAHNPKIK